MMCVTVNRHTSCMKCVTVNRHELHDRLHGCFECNGGMKTAAKELSSTGALAT
jgi:hypothetical protein